MAEYLDKAGLTYLWAKIKTKLNLKADNAKLNLKADNDKYKIDTFNTQKKTYSVQKLYDLGGTVDLTTPSSNNFVETFPSGYHIACILAVYGGYFTEGGDYIKAEHPHEILPVGKYSNGTAFQTWRVNLAGDAPMSTGEQTTFTLLLEKD